MGSLGPLLQNPTVNPHATLLTCFTNLMTDPGILSGWLQRSKTEVEKAFEKSFEYLRQPSTDLDKLSNANTAKLFPTAINHVIDVEKPFKE